MKAPKSAAIWIAVTVVNAALLLSGALIPVEQRLTDLRVRWYSGRVQPDDRIVIIAIDEESLRRLDSELGAWPWPRSVYAQLLANCSQAKCVAFDILFAERDPGEDEILASAIRSAGNVVLASLPDVQPTPHVKDAAAGTGFVNYVTDTDGVLRGYPMSESLPLQAALHLGPTPPQWPVDDIGRFRFVPLRNKHKAVSFWEVLKGEVPPDAFKDKLVFIGSTAAGLQGDRQVTSIDVYTPGVEVMAWVADGLANHRYFRILPPTGAAVLAFITGLIPLVFPLRRPTMAAAVFAAWVAGILLIDLTALGAARWLLPLGAILVCSITGHVAAGGAAWLTDRRERLRLEKLEARKQQFTDMLVHDLRNQVAPVSMAIDMLVAKEDAPSFVSTAQASLTRMVANLNTLLDIRRTEEGKMPVQLQSTDLSELLNQLHAEYTTLAARKNLQFTCHCDANLVASQLDPDLVRRILENLLLNALQYAKKEGALELAAVKDGATLMLAVQNDGPAITADHQQRLFNLYEAGDRAERHAFGGSGIGLAFCKEATETMGGTIRVESPWRDGQGVRIEMTFPRDPME